MIVFERLFGAYYFMILKKRKFNKYFKNFLFRSTDEDSSAFTILIASQILSLGVILAIFKSRHYFIMESSSIIKGIAIYGGLVFFQYRHFLSNRDRRRKIIEEFRNLSNREKIIWNIVSMLIIIIPIVLFPIIL